MNLSRALGLAAGAAVATSASAAPTFIMSVGDRLFVREGGVTQDFSLQDNITSLTVTPGGEVIGASPSDDGNGLFEMYRIDNPTTAPTLSLLGDFLSTNSTSLTYVGDTLYALQQVAGDAAKLVTIDLGAMTETVVGQTGVFSVNAAGSGYDPATDTFYIMNRGIMGELWDLDYDVTAPAEPTATLIGQGTQRYQNHAGEFFGGKMYGLAQTAVGTDRVDVWLGEIDTATGGWTLIEQILDDEPVSSFKDGKPSIGLAVIPAPGAAPILGLGALALARRRRR